MLQKRTAPYYENEVAKVVSCCPLFQCPCARVQPSVVASQQCDRVRRSVRLCPVPCVTYRVPLPANIFASPAVEWCNQEEDLSEVVILVWLLPNGAAWQQPNSNSNTEHEQRNLTLPLLFSSFFLIET